jgi:hypothetical protein
VEVAVGLFCGFGLQANVLGFYVLILTAHQKKGETKNVEM